MSLVFSDTTNKFGMIQRIEDRLGFDYGDISGDSDKLKKFTQKINAGMTEAWGLIFSVGGTWQFDDSNHTDYPIISRNLVSGQRDYALTKDANNNLILDIQRVMIADENGNFRIITPVDVAGGYAPSNFYDGLNTTGQPNTYEKNANGIFLDPPANYNYPLGLKVYVSREGVYFTTSDTTSKPGFAGLFHEYPVICACYEYALDKSLPSVERLYREKQEMKNALMDHYKLREKDVNKTLTPFRNNAH